jgi:hypothetical protein
MKIRLYSIKDRLLGAFLAPFSARADVEAVRQLRASMQDPSLAKSQLVLCPQDYDLYYVATFDDETGQLDGTRPDLVLPLTKINATEITYAEKMGSDHSDQS